MATNPNRRNARGVWKLKDIQSFKQDGEYPNGAAIGIFAGGGGPSSNVIDFIQTSSTGNAADFGDLVATTVGPSVTSNATRCLISGGYEPSVQWSDRIQYITPSTKGNTSDFGNLTTGCGYPAGMSNNTRVVQSNGHEGDGAGSTTLNTEMDTMLFASLGNSTDFGDMTSPAKYGEAAASNSVRGVIAGGRDPDASPIYVNDIDMFNFASTGSASDFGDLAQATNYFGGCSDGITAMFINGGQNANSTQAVQIMSTGNATDFNDTTIRDNGAPLAAGNRAINGGGRTANPGPSVNIIEFFDIKSRADAADFGDLTAARLFYGPSADSTNNGGQEVTPSQLGLKRIDRDDDPLISDDRSAALFAGGSTPSRTNVIDKVNIAVNGNAVDFGDLTGARYFVGSTSNQNYMITFGGNETAGAANKLNTIEFSNFHTGGLAGDFGNLTNKRENQGGVSSNTRGVMGAGHEGPAHTNIIDFITYASHGNATDFGDDTVSRLNYGSAESPTRGLFAGGYSPSNQDVISYITIASAGNATDFGDLSASARGQTGTSSPTRALFAGGNNPGKLDVIEYVTIATTGDVTDFGNLQSGTSAPEGTSNKTRGIFAGGNDGSLTNTIDLVTIASTGNATDFGDLTLARAQHGGSSNGHGGL